MHPLPESLEVPAAAASCRLGSRGNRRQPLRCLVYTSSMLWFLACTATAPTRDGPKVEQAPTEVKEVKGSDEGEGLEIHHGRTEVFDQSMKRFASISTLLA